MSDLLPITPAILASFVCFGYMFHDMHAKLREAEGRHLASTIERLERELGIGQREE